MACFYFLGPGFLGRGLRVQLSGFLSVGRLPVLRRFESRPGKRDMLKAHIRAYVQCGPAVPHLAALNTHRMRAQPS